MTIFPSPRKPDHLTERPLFADDQKFASSQITFFHYLIVAVFFFLASGYWNIQVTDSDYYQELAHSNTVRSLPLPAARGRILDRDGRVIVDNLSSFSCLLSRERLKDEHLPLIAEGLNLDLQELKERLNRFRRQARYVPVIIKENLTPADVAFVESNHHQEMFPEIELIHSVRRVYPKEQFLSHVLGYVGEASEAELDRPEYAAFNPGDTIGKDGLERFYNATLMGKDGQRVSLVNNRGKELQVMTNKDAEPGKPLTLTIDLDVQAAAELSLEGKRGAVVALDPRTGEVLAMVSRPAFDPNKFSTRISNADWKAILEDPETPMFNRALQSRLAPGSAVKPLVALAALEEGVITPDHTVNCPGHFFYVDHDFRCHLRSGHGRVGLRYALAQSCDVFFYNVGLSLGIDRLAKWGEMAGLGRKTGIDLPGESTGDMPSRAWKMQRMRQGWLHGDMINVSIGQGYLTTTPLQLAHAIGGIASGAVWNPPHMVRGETLREKPRVAKVNIENVQQVIGGMYAVVNQGGTATEAWLPGIEVCGKTGTSQLISNETMKRRNLTGIVKDNAWFAGFAPRSNPEIVVAALIEGGEHGDRAGIIARDVIKAYFDKKARNKPANPVAPLTAAVPGVKGQR